MEEPIANSSMFARPTNTAPALRRRETAVASAGGRKPRRIRDAHVAWRPDTHMLSLIAMGTPARGSSSPAATRASTERASSSARSGVTSRKAPTRPSSAPTRARASPRTSTADDRRERTSSAVATTPAGRELSVRSGKAGSLATSDDPGDDAEAVGALGRVLGKRAVALPRSRVVRAQRCGPHDLRGGSDPIPESPSAGRCRRQSGRAGGSRRKALRPGPGVGPGRQSGARRRESPPKSGRTSDDCKAEDQFSRLPRRN